MGLAAPAAGPGWEKAVTPVLGSLLFVTFLQVPVAELTRSWRDTRFLGAVLTVNFGAVPIVVAVMLVLLPDDTALRLGVLLVLLSPCVDYVIVFAGLAGGSSRRLLAATPLLLLVQIVLLPVFLVLFLGSDIGSLMDAGPFLSAFLTLTVVPLGLAWAVQFWARRRPAGAAVAARAGSLMVPLMGATLLLVVVSQIPRLDGRWGQVAVLVPLFVAFLVVMVLVGRGVARVFRLAVPESRAVVYSGATRNSLVVLPLALALPEPLAIAAAVIVTQTLVEIIGMVVFVRLIPRWVP